MFLPICISYFGSTSLICSFFSSLSEYSSLLSKPFILQAFLLLDRLDILQFFYKVIAYTSFCLDFVGACFVLYFHSGHEQPLAKAFYYLCFLWPPLSLSFGTSYLVSVCLMNQFCQEVESWQPIKWLHWNVDECNDSVSLPRDTTSYYLLPILHFPLGVHTPSYCWTLKLNLDREEINNKENGEVY